MYNHIYIYMTSKRINLHNILINIIDLDFRSIEESVKVTQLNNIQ